KRLALIDIGSYRDVLTRRRTQAVDDVYVERGVGILVVVVRIEFHGHAGQNGIGDGLRARRNRTHLAANAVIVTIALIEDDSGHAVYIRAVRRKLRTVVERNRKG